MITLEDKQQDWAFDKPHPNTPLGKLLDNETGAPLFLKRKNSDYKEQPLLSFERYFNPDLTLDSAYFRSLNETISCVKRHADKELTP